MARGKQRPYTGEHYRVDKALDDRAALDWLAFVDVSRQQRHTFDTATGAYLLDDESDFVYASLLQAVFTFNAQAHSYMTEEGKPSKLAWVDLAFNKNLRLSRLHKDNEVLRGLGHALLRPDENFVQRMAYESMEKAMVTDLRQMPKPGFEFAAAVVRQEVWLDPVKLGIAEELWR